MAVILVRCDDCGEAACLLKCERDAISGAAGDMLVDTAKCSLCEKWGAAGDDGLPSCVAQCAQSARKSLRTGSLREKRIAAVERMY